MRSKHYELPSPRLTRGEYWLMETMAECAIPTGWLGRDNLGEIVNKPPHGLSHSDLVETILELLQQGLMGLKKRDGSPVERAFSSRAQIQNALADVRCRPPKTYLFLTSEGGRVWEAFAAPKWDVYISELYGFDESLHQDVGELICTNRGRLQRYFESGYPSLYQIDPGRVWWDQLKPWQATNWKVLPMAHRVRFGLPDGWEELRSPPSQSTYPPRWYRWD